MAISTDIASDIAMLQTMIEGPDAGLAVYLVDHPYLATAQDARDDLGKLIASLEEVRAGRVVPHADIVKDMEARRRARIQAAE
uniref:hypothetical protein n=1 Tax=uncultured Sphingomonas sp. TaxID=158754 RepID=UPI0035C9F4CF